MEANIVLTVILFTILNIHASHQNIENEGYILYCPCMGRFGNQADHFLGAISFSRALNRTLVLPPWVEYQKGKMRSTQIPFDKYFEVETLRKYHRVILMADFMHDIAPTIWPPEKRISFCYMERKSVYNSNSKVDCNAKDGNPFGPFWDEFAIDFIGSEFYSPLHFDVHHTSIAQTWKEKYSSAVWPVLAFTGAPASFPVQEENRHIQQFLVWSADIINVAKEFINNSIPKGAFIGIHLRNGIDWVRACEHIHDSKHLFASPQCLGSNNQFGALYPDLCLQSKELVVRQLKRLIKNIKQLNPSNQVRSIFVSSDANHMIQELTVAFVRMNITIIKFPRENSHVDLAILGLANYFIGNCISSFSAFVKRERDVKGIPSYFWSFPNEKERSAMKDHEEL